LGVARPRPCRIRPVDLVRDGKRLRRSPIHEISSLSRLTREHRADVTGSLCARVAAGAWTHPQAHKNPTQLNDCSIDASSISVVEKDRGLYCTDSRDFDSACRTLDSGGILIFDYACRSHALDIVVVNGMAVRMYFFTYPIAFTPLWFKKLENRRTLVWSIGVFMAHTIPDGIGFTFCKFLKTRFSGEFRGRIYPIHLRLCMYINFKHTRSYTNINLRTR
jgi:hypothetical protein